MLPNSTHNSISDQLYGPHFGIPGDPSSLINLVHELDNISPTIRIFRNLEILYYSPDRWTTQRILDFLAHHGHITPQLLELFRSSSDIEVLDLEKSLGKEVIAVAGTEIRDDLLAGLRIHSGYEL